MSYSCAMLRMSSPSLASTVLMRFPFESLKWTLMLAGVSKGAQRQGGMGDVPSARLWPVNTEMPSSLTEVSIGRARMKSCTNLMSHGRHAFEDRCSSERDRTLEASEAGGGKGGTRGEGLGNGRGTREGRTATLVQVWRNAWTR